MQRYVAGDKRGGRAEHGAERRRPGGDEHVEQLIAARSSGYLGVAERNAPWPVMRRGEAVLAGRLTAHQPCGPSLRRSPIVSSSPSSARPAALLGPGQYRFIESSPACARSVPSATIGRLERSAICCRDTTSLTASGRSLVADDRRARATSSERPVARCLPAPPGGCRGPVRDDDAEDQCRRGRVARTLASSRRTAASIRFEDRDDVVAVRCSRTHGSRASRLGRGADAPSAPPAPRSSRRRRCAAGVTSARNRLGGPHASRVPVCLVHRRDSGAASRGGPCGESVRRCAHAFISRQRTPHSGRGTDLRPPGTAGCSRRARTRYSAEPGGSLALGFRVSEPCPSPLAAVLVAFGRSLVADVRRPLYVPGSLNSVHSVCPVRAIGAQFLEPALRRRSYAAAAASSLNPGPTRLPCSCDSLHSFGCGRRPNSDRHGCILSPSSTVVPCVRSLASIRSRRELSIVVARFRACPGERRRPSWGLRFSFISGLLTRCEPRSIVHTT